MKARLIKMWTVPEFKEKLHIEAIKSGMTLTKYQKYISDNNMMIKDVFKKKGGRQFVI